VEIAQLKLRKLEQLQITFDKRYRMVIGEGD